MFYFFGFPPVVCFLLVFFYFSGSVFVGLGGFLFVLVFVFVYFHLFGFCCFDGFLSFMHCVVGYIVNRNSFFTSKQTAPAKTLFSPHIPKPALNPPLLENAYFSFNSEYLYTFFHPFSTPKTPFFTSKTPFFDPKIAPDA